MQPHITSANIHVLSMHHRCGTPQPHHNCQSGHHQCPGFRQVPSRHMHVIFAVRTHALVPNFGMSQLWMVDGLAGCTLCVNAHTQTPVQHFC